MYRHPLRVLGMPFFGCIFLCASFFFFYPNQNIHAQTTADSISVSTTPNVPGPNQTVIFQLKSYSVNLDRSQISWSVDDKQLLSGTGEKRFTAKSGPIGSTTKIVVNIVTPSLEQVQKNILLQPAAVDLLIESANGYAPPFYEGRSLPSLESTVRIVALPAIQNAGGRSLTPADFVFTWKRNLKTAQAASGYGKNVFTFKKNYLDPEETISLSASSLQEGYAVEKNITLQSFNPQVLFYENDPLRGIRYDHALFNTFSLNKGERSIAAVPYFFSVTNPGATALSYTWNLGNTALATPEKKNVLNLKSASTKGSVPLTLSVENSRLLFEKNNASITINLE